MDYSWFAADETQIALSNSILHFFAEHDGGIGKHGDHYTTVGAMTRPNWSPGLESMNAVAALASNDTIAWDFVDYIFNNITIPSGDAVDSDRYYSGFLYLEALLHLSGKYRAWL